MSDYSGGTGKVWDVRHNDVHWTHDGYQTACPTALLIDGLHSPTTREITCEQCARIASERGGTR